MRPQTRKQYKQRERESVPWSCGCEGRRGVGFTDFAGDRPLAAPVEGTAAAQRPLVGMGAKREARVSASSAEPESGTLRIPRNLGWWLCCLSPAPCLSLPLDLLESPSALHISSSNLYYRITRCLHHLVARARNRALHVFLVPVLQVSVLIVWAMYRIY
jgi:hypothetical protein